MTKTNYLLISDYLEPAYNLSILLGGDNAVLSGSCLDRASRRDPCRRRLPACRFSNDVALELADARYLRAHHHHLLAGGRH